MVAQIPVPAEGVGGGMSSPGPAGRGPPPLAAVPAYADGETAARVFRGLETNSSDSANSPGRQLGSLMALLPV